MSNIYQHNFDNCMKMRLSNSDYWDLFLCYDCTDEQDNNQILDDCILVDIDINNDNSFSGDTLYSLTTWTGATINGSGITLNDNPEPCKVYRCTYFGYDLVEEKVCSKDESNFNVMYYVLSKSQSHNIRDLTFIIISLIKIFFSSSRKNKSYFFFHLTLEISVSFNIDKIPKIDLCLLPTPIIALNRLSNYLGGPQIYMKRDDLTGVAFGGNKNRKLEYLLADALQQGADTIITEGAVNSNHCLQTAACASKLGLDCELVLSGPEPSEITGNFLLFKILEVPIYFASSSSERKKSMRIKFLSFYEYIFNNT